MSGARMGRSPVISRHTAIEIRAAYKSGKPCKEVAVIFNVSTSVVYGAVTGKHTECLGLPNIARGYKKREKSKIEGLVASNQHGNYADLIIEGEK